MSVVIIIFCTGRLKPQVWIYGTTASMPFCFQPTKINPQRPLIVTPRQDTPKDWMLVAPFQQNIIHQ